MPSAETSDQKAKENGARLHGTWQKPAEAKAVPQFDPNASESSVFAAKTACLAAEVLFTSLPAEVQRLVRGIKTELSVSLPVGPFTLPECSEFLLHGTLSTPSSPSCIKNPQRVSKKRSSTPGMAAETPVSAMAAVHSISLPWSLPLPKKNIRVAYQAPSTIEEVGSYVLGALTRRQDGCSVDLAVQIPNILLGEKDHLNNVYFVKRAFYLACVARTIAQIVGECGAKQAFAYDRGDLRRPLLHIWFPRGGRRQCMLPSIVVRPVVGETVFSVSQLAPLRNCVRPTPKNPNTDGNELDVTLAVAASTSNPPTPYYNSSLLADTNVIRHCSETVAAIASHPSIPHALCLLRVWCAQRGLTQWSFVLTNLLTSMAVRRTIQPEWSSFEIMRILWFWVTKQDFTKALSLHTDKTGTVNGVQLAHFDQINHIVAVVDNKGHNLTWWATQEDVAFVKWQSHKALEYLRTESFRELFMERQPAHTTFDHLVSVPMPSQEPAFFNETEKLDYPCLYGFLRRTLPRLLKKALGTRIKFVCHVPSVKAPSVTASCGAGKRKRMHQKEDVGELYSLGTDAWAVGEPAPPHGSDQKQALLFGLILQAAEYDRLADQGPDPTEEPEAAEIFRKIWGERAELRRRPADGRIIESVKWDDELEKYGSSVAGSTGVMRNRLVGTSPKRVPGTVFELVVTALLDRHLGFTKGTCLAFGQSVRHHGQRALLQQYLPCAAEQSKKANKEYRDIAAMLEEDIPEVPFAVTRLRRKMRGTIFRMVRLVENHGPVADEANADAAAKERNEATAVSLAVPFIDRYAAEIELELESAGMLPSERHAREQMETLLLSRYAREIESRIPGVKEARVVTCCSPPVMEIEMKGTGNVYAATVLCRRTHGSMQMEKPKGTVDSAPTVDDADAGFELVETEYQTEPSVQTWAFWLLRLWMQKQLLTNHFDELESLELIRKAVKLGGYSADWDFLLTVAGARDGTPVVDAQTLFLRAMHILAVRDVDGDDNSTEEKPVDDPVVRLLTRRMRSLARATLAGFEAAATLQAGQTCAKAFSATATKDDYDVVIQLCNKEPRWTRAFVLEITARYAGVLQIFSDSNGDLKMAPKVITVGLLVDPRSRAPREASKSLEEDNLVPIDNVIIFIGSDKLIMRPNINSILDEVRRLGDGMVTRLHVNKPDVLDLDAAQHFEN